MTYSSTSIVWYRDNDFVIDYRFANIERREKHRDRYEYRRIGNMQTRASPIGELFFFVID